MFCLHDIGLVRTCKGALGAGASRQGNEEETEAIMRTAISATLSRVSRPIGFLTAAASIVFLGVASPIEAAPCVGLVAIVAGQLGATCDDGTAPIGIFGTVLAADSSGYQNMPFAAPDYDYVLTGPPAVLAAGNVADFVWVHEADAFGSESGAPGDGAQWQIPLLLY